MIPKLEESHQSDSQTLQLKINTCLGCLVHEYTGQLTDLSWTESWVLKRAMIRKSARHRSEQYSYHDPPLKRVRNVIRIKLHSKQREDQANLLPMLFAFDGVSDNILLNKNKSETTFCYQHSCAGPKDVSLGSINWAGIAVTYLRPKAPQGRFWFLPASRKQRNASKYD